MRYLGPKLESTTVIVGTVPWNRECTTVAKHAREEAAKEKREAAVRAAASSAR